MTGSPLRFTGEAEYFAIDQLVDPFREMLAVEGRNKPRKSGITSLATTPREPAISLFEPSADTLKCLSQSLEGVHTMTEFHPGIGRNANVEWALPVAAPAARSSNPHAELLSALCVLKPS
jgi:hypothetical protein